MKVLHEPWREVPPNWALHWGITSNCAMLAAIARDGAFAPDGSAQSKGTVFAIGEAAIPSDQAETFGHAQRMKALLDAIKFRMMKLEVKPEMVRLAAVESSVRRNAGPRDWLKTTKLFDKVGLPLRVAPPILNRMPAFEALCKKPTSRAAPRIVVSPQCAQLAQAELADLSRGSRDSADCIRALYLAVSTPFPVS